MNQSSHFEAYRGKVLYLMLAVILLNLTFPISETGTGGAIFFLFVFTGVVVSSAYFTRGHPKQFSIMVVLAVINVALGIPAQFFPESVVAPLWFLSVFIFLLWLVIVLVSFIFRVNKVDRDVLFGGVTIYLVLADTFIPLYNLIELLQPGSFVSSNAIPFGWQRFLYFSFATITTLGYGDIVPVKPWAQSIAAFEAALGVLYVAILMSRLVGLYRQDGAEDNLL